jgi:hypothetical protein
MITFFISLLNMAQDLKSFRNIANRKIFTSFQINLNIVFVHTKKVIKLMYIYTQCHGPF